MRYEVRIAPAVRTILRSLPPPTAFELVTHMRWLARSPQEGEVVDRLPFKDARRMPVHVPIDDGPDILFTVWYIVDIAAKTVDVVALGRPEPDAPGIPPGF